MSQFEPQLSVIIVVGTRRDRAGRALKSILSQDGMEQAEVILVDTQAAAAPVAGSDHPGVRPETHNAKAGVGSRDAVWLMNPPPPYRPPAGYAQSRNIPGHNSAYRRD